MRNVALGIGIGAILIVVMFVGRLITGDLAGNSWPIRPMKLDFKEMPKTLGDWSIVESGAIAPDVFERLGATEAQERTYEDQHGNKIGCHISIFEEFHSSVPHTPLQCYPAQGWETLDQETRDIPLPDGPPLHAILASFEKEGEKAYVLYWFQFGDFTVVNDQELRAALEYYRPDGEWPSAVKIMMHMPGSSNIQNTDPLVDLGARIYEHTRLLQNGKIPESHKIIQTPAQETND